VIGENRIGKPFEAATALAMGKVERSEQMRSN